MCVCVCVCVCKFYILFSSHTPIYRLVGGEHGCKGTVMYNDVHAAALYSVQYCAHIARAWTCACAHFCGVQLPRFLVCVSGRFV